MKSALDQLSSYDASLTSFLHSHALSLIGGLLLLSVVLGVLAVVSVRRRAARSQLLMLCTALLLGWAGMLAHIAAHSQRLGWTLLAMGCVLAAVWPLLCRRGDETQVGAPETPQPTPRNELNAQLAPGPSSAWRIGIFTTVLLLASAVYRYRQLDTPGVLDAYGTQAMVAAKRLVQGQLSIAELVLYHEMTQEECGYSLPFVLWHAAFQAAYGGLSVSAARSAAMVAGLLGVVLMYRVGRALGGPILGLASMAVYAFLPSAIFAARTEAIYGFSVLLLFAAFDAVLGFVLRPTWWRAIWLGLLVPLVGYGLANIRLMFLAGVVLLLVVVIRDKTFRRGGGKRLALAMIVSTALLAPQFANWRKVQIQVRGRGEHIFAGAFEQLLIMDKSAERWPQRAAILYKNAQFIAQRTLGFGGDMPPALPPLLVVPMLVGLAGSLGRAFRKDRLFLLVLWFTSYLAPAISMYATDVRLMLLGPAQALMAAVVWADVYALARSTRARALAGLLVGVPVAILCADELARMHGLLSARPPLPQLRDFLSTQARGKLVFFTDEADTALNFLRWNPPTFGRDSTAEVPVTGIRRMDIPATLQMIESLRIPALVATDGAVGDLAIGAQWSVLGVGTSTMSVLEYRGAAAGRNYWTVAMDAVRLEKGSKLWAGLLSYRSPYLFIAPLSTGLRWRIPVPMNLERVAVIARTLDRGSVSIQVEFGSLGSQVLRAGSSGEDRIGAAWAYMGGPLPKGQYDLTLSPLDGQRTINVDDVTVLGTLANEPRDR